MTHLYGHNSSDNPFKDPKHDHDSKLDNKRRDRERRARERGAVFPGDECPTTTENTTTPTE